MVAGDTPSLSAICLADKPNSFRRFLYALLYPCCHLFANIIKLY